MFVLGLTSILNNFPVFPLSKFPWKVEEFIIFSKDSRQIIIWWFPAPTRQSSLTRGRWSQQSCPAFLPLINFGSSRQDRPSRARPESRHLVRGDRHRPRPPPRYHSGRHLQQVCRLLSGKMVSYIGSFGKELLRGDEEIIQQTGLQIFTIIASRDTTWYNRARNGEREIVSKSWQLRIQIQLLPWLRL